MKVTSEPPPFSGLDVAWFAAAALRKPCGVAQISIVRSSAFFASEMAVTGKPVAFPPVDPNVQPMPPATNSWAPCPPPRAAAICGTGRQRVGSITSLAALWICEVAVL